MNIPWKLKSRIFGAIDLLSAPYLLYFLQRNVTGRSRITSLEISENWLQHLEALKKHDATDVVFEFGAGKNLAQNLFLSGDVGKQIVVDLNPMLDLALVEAARALLASKARLPADRQITTASDLEAYGIEYKAPFDAARTGFAANSIDACISTNTLEHIPEESIIRIFRELHRILKPDGIVSAKIDYSDHYAHTDQSISLLNYLDYSEEQWKKYNHDCHFQNRLRHYDYVRIFDECGFEVLDEQVIFDEPNVPQSMKQRFQAMPETWAATSAHLVLAKK